MSPDETGSMDDLVTINEIIDTLNRAVDMRGALDLALSRLLDLMTLETGWIFLRDPSADDLWDGRGYVLAADANLPPALALDNPHAWNKGCDCQGLCNKNKLTEAYNEVTCSRLESTKGDDRGLMVHASVPIPFGEKTLGILNVAASDWTDFSEHDLDLLTRIGSHMGVALERAQSFDLLRERRLDEQQALLNISNQLLGRLDLDELIAYLIEQIPTLLDADACAILLPDEGGASMRIIAADGWKRDLAAEGWRIPIAGGDALDALMREQSMISQAEETGIHLHPALDQAIIEEGFRYVVLMPLVAERRTVGAMMINTREPWEGLGADLQFLRLISNQAAIALEKARLHQVELLKQRMEDELAFSKQIQMSMLPKYVPKVEGWDFAASYYPARQVSGDFYDWFYISKRDERWGVVIADVVDKSMAAALYMILSRTMIRSAALGGFPPVEALTQANAWILRDSQASLFLTAFYALIHVKTGAVTFSNAGHLPALWLRREDEAIQELTTPGTVLGYFEGIELAQAQVEVAPGDALVFYTDGVTEALNRQGEEYGVERLHQVILEHAGASAEALIQAVVDSIKAFMDGAVQADDIALVCVRRE